MSEPGRILKGAAPVPGRRVEAAVFDADRRVREAVAAAEAEAARIREDARADGARLRAEAEGEGRAEGRAEAAALLARAAVARDALLAGARGEVVELALAVARKVLGREVEAGAAADVAAQALAAARDRREVVLRVHPEDAVAVRAGADRLAALLLHAPLALREDPRVERGGAVVETEAGRIDARIETQLDALAAALREALP